MSESRKNYLSNNVNPRIGFHWIYNDELKQSKIIKDHNELNKLLSEGWKLGRKIKF